MRESLRNRFRLLSLSRSLALPLSRALLLSLSRTCSLSLSLSHSLTHSLTLSNSLCLPTLFLLLSLSLSSWCSHARASHTTCTNVMSGEGSAPRPPRTPPSNPSSLFDTSPQDGKDPTQLYQYHDTNTQTNIQAPKRCSKFPPTFLLLVLALFLHPSF